MTQDLINIYCDESCHLENDHQSLMVLGGVWLKQTDVKNISQKIKSLKEKFEMPRYREIKWTKISPAKLDFYKGLIDLFFDEEKMCFRGLIALNKQDLCHDQFSGQSHDIWYYKMYFSMLKQILNKNNFYNIYLDIKDTRGTPRIKKLHDVLSNNMYDFDRNIIKKIQLIRSEESEIIQLADILIGALSYLNRKLNTSTAKKQIIDHIKQRAGLSLEKNTLLQEKKFNLFLWQPQNKGLF
jgi:hypothetical protein